ncbi:MAG: hypothetical protein ABSA49_05455 [Rhizomicrobium sp.]|jgi:uncharacterized membrane protein
MAKVGAAIYQTIIVLGAVGSILSGYYGWRAYQDGHPASTMGAIVTPHFFAALAFGILAVALLLVGILGLRRSRATERDTAAATESSMGDVTGNRGIVSQGQTGDNSLGESAK